MIAPKIPTPRTDAACRELGEEHQQEGVVDADFTRQLERELAEMEKRCLNYVVINWRQAEKFAECQRELANMTIDRDHCAALMVAGANELAARAANAYRDAVLEEAARICDYRTSKKGRDDEAENEAGVCAGNIRALKSNAAAKPQRRRYG